MLFNHLLLQQVNVVQRHAGGWMHSFMPQPSLPGVLLDCHDMSSSSA